LDNIDQQLQEVITGMKNEQALKDQQQQMQQMQHMVLSGGAGMQQLQLPNPGLSQNPALTFAEQQAYMTQNDQAMPKMGGLLRIQNANVALIALGVVASTMIGDKLAGLIPGLGRFATIIAGGIILMFVRSGPIRDVAAGILIGGLADLLRSYTGGMFGMGSSGNNMMAEDVKTTYGGGEGVYPEQPGRRTFA
jgi:hypothetical protein